jgi:hypothetical protein
MNIIECGTGHHFLRRANAAKRPAAATNGEAADFWVCVVDTGTCGAGADVADMGASAGAGGEGDGVTGCGVRGTVTVVSTMTEGAVREYSVSCMAVAPSLGFCGFSTFTV